MSLHFAVLDDTNKIFGVLKMGSGRINSYILPGHFLLVLPLYKLIFNSFQDISIVSTCICKLLYIEIAEAFLLRF